MHSIKPPFLHEMPKLIHDIRLDNELIIIVNLRN